MRLHRKTTTMRAGVALSTLLAAVLVPTIAGATPNHAVSTITIRTLMKAVAFTSVDADHNGKPSVGDYSVVRVVHVNPRTGKQIGTGTAICTQVNTAGTLLDCQGSDVFPGGEIREAGRFTLAKKRQLSILGGSGIYDGASGSVNGTWLDPKYTKSSVTFQITKAK